MEIISRFLLEDHRHLDGRYREFQRLTAQETISAGETFSQFVRSLDRHRKWEEEFPLFEQRSGMTGIGPSAVMRTEHRCFLIDRIQDRLNAGSLLEGFEAQLLDARITEKKKICCIHEWTACCPKRKRAC